MKNKKCKKCGGGSFREHKQKYTTSDGSVCVSVGTICSGCANLYSKKFYADKKEEVFNHYGRQCNCCGECILQFLSIDHINNDEHKEVWASNGRRITGIQLYARIVASGFPDYYQTLCMNCNFGKRMNDGICPHKV